MAARTVATTGLPVEYVTHAGVQLPFFADHHLQTLHPTKLREHAMLLYRTVGHQVIGTAVPISDAELLGWIMNVQRVHLGHLRTASARPAHPLVEMQTDRAAATAAMYIQAGDKENIPEMLRLLEAKDESAQSLQRSLEGERRQRRASQAEASAERATLQERFRYQEAELQRRVQELETQCEQQRDEHHAKSARLAEQLEEARAREAALLEKNEALARDVRRLLARAEGDAAEILALRARVDALSADLSEAQEALKLSTEVRSGFLRDSQEQADALEKTRAELRELHLVERTGRENSQAQYERLNAQCESLARQAQDRGREVDVLEERCKRLEETLRVKTLDSERAIREADERRRDSEARIARFEDETVALRDELKARGAVEAKLRETNKALEAQLEDHKVEEQRLRQELFRQQSAADERDLQLQAGKRREQHLAETVATLEERLRATAAESESRQTALFSTRGQVQTLELELQGLRDASALLRGEMSRVKAAEEEIRQDIAKRLEERVAQRDADILVLQDQLTEQRRQIAEHKSELDRGSLDASRDKGEFAAALAQKDSEIASRDDALVRLRSDLTAAKADLTAAKADLTAAKADLTAAKDHWQELEAELSQARQEAESARQRADAMEVDAAAARGTHTPMVAEKEVQTSPQLMPGLDPLPRAGQLWGCEIAALHRSVESLQAMVSIPRSPSNGLPGPCMQVYSEFMSKLQADASAATQEIPKRTAPGRDCARAVFCTYVERRIWLLHKRVALMDAWQVWAMHVHTAEARAQMELAVADELWLATECKAREQGLTDVLGARWPEQNGVTLKRLVLEFRHRIAAALSEMMTGAPERARTLLMENLADGRKSLGRLLHAALFLYQKLRTLVPSELQESLQDPLSKLVPMPFYVLPYKAQLALKHGAAAIVRGGCRCRRSRSPLRMFSLHAPEAEDKETRPVWLEALVLDLEERLPLASSSQTEVPSFIAHALLARMQVASTGNACYAEGTVPAQDMQIRDRLDVLVVDALTVFMSAWRFVPDAHRRLAGTAAQVASRRQPSITLEEAAAGASSGVRLAAASPRRELRLGSWARS